MIKLIERTAIAIGVSCVYMALIIAVGKGVDWLVDKVRAALGK